MSKLKKMPLVITVIDDVPETISEFLNELCLEKYWDDVRLHFKDGEVGIAPELNRVFPSEDKTNLHEFLDQVKNNLFGADKYCASLSENYIPSQIFLIDWKFDRLDWDHKVGDKPTGIDICNDIKNIFLMHFVLLSLFTIH